MPPQRNPRLVKAATAASDMSVTSVAPIGLAGALMSTARPQAWFDHGICDSVLPAVGRIRRGA